MLVLAMWMYHLNVRQYLFYRVQYHQQKYLHHWKISIVTHLLMFLSEIRRQGKTPLFVKSQVRCLIETSLNLLTWKSCSRYYSIGKTSYNFFIRVSFKTQLQIEWKQAIGKNRPYSSLYFVLTHEHSDI